MASIAVVASPGTFIASLGAMIDAHSRMGETFAANPALGDYARMQTGIVLAPTQGSKLMLAGGRMLDTDLAMDRIKDARLIYLPSFQVADPDRLETLCDETGLHAWLRARTDEGRLIGACGASVCHLAAAGLLDGKVAAGHPRLVTGFRRLFPATTIDTLHPVMHAGRLLTCGPYAANMQLVFDMLAAAFGMAVARNLFRREPAFPETADAVTGDPLVVEAKLWMHERFARDFRIGELAAMLGVSHQTLARRFLAAGEESPRAFVQKMRVDSAATMLTETRRPEAEIAQLVGYSDIASFRAVFQREKGISPSRYRRDAAFNAAAG